MEEVPNIPSFFRGQHVLVTGATGFLGKAVIEKLLRCCSDVAKITVLIRQKKGKDPQKRLQEYLNDMVFERVKREKPGAINKVEAISGDLMAVGLGLSPEDRQMLEENVSVIFHSGASTRFDDPLKKALAVNTRGTLEVVNLAKKMKNLKVLLHISTAYCNCDKYEIDEVLYPAPCDWKKLLSAMDHVDDHTLDILTSKILGRLPNTYTFTKALAEHVVNDVAKDLPVVICRPTVVISTLEEPFPGWVDNYKGYMGILLAVNMGLLSVLYVDSNKRVNLVFADQVTNALLVAAWEKAVLSKEESPTIFNMAQNFTTAVPLSEAFKVSVESQHEVPGGYVFWQSRLSITCNIYKYYILVIFLNFFVGLCLDWVLKWLNPNKISLVKVYRKLHNSNLSFKTFLENEWDFKNEKLHWLKSIILPEDKETFDFGRFEDPSSSAIFKVFILGARRFLLKDHDCNMPHHLAHMKRMIWIVRTYYCLLCLFLCWVGYKCYLLYIGSAEGTTVMEI